MKAWSERQKVRDEGESLIIPNEKSLGRMAIPLGRMDDVMKFFFIKFRKSSAKGK